MKKISVIALVLFVMVLTSCMSTGPNCLTAEKYRFQRNYNGRGSKPSCLTPDCQRYQVRYR